jgi:predicted RNA-binding Zn ribbon-like protein
MEMGRTTSANDLPLLGGALCLDFANTVSWRGREEPREWLTSYDHLVDWACRARVVAEETGHTLRRTARADPAAAPAALERARDLREAIYRAFSRQAGGHTPARADLERIRARYVDAVRHASFTAPSETDRWFWLDDGGSDLDLVTRAVARSGVELALSPDLARVRECLGEGCAWLFLDQSRNRSRRWCSSADCGNRARVRRFHERRRGTTR